MAETKIIMKTYFVFLSLFVILLSCTKDEPATVFPDYILAGEKDQFRLKGIMYTRIQPASRLLWDDYNNLPIYEDYSIDLNNDGVDDFKFIRSRVYTDDYDSLKIRLVTLDENELVAHPDNPEIIDAIHLFDTINAQSNWIHDVNIIYDEYQVNADTVRVGVWQNQQLKYIGARIHHDDQWLYGWIGISVREGWGNRLGIHAYAATVGYKP